MNDEVVSEIKAALADAFPDLPHDRAAQISEVALSSVLRSLQRFFVHDEEGCVHFLKTGERIL